MKTVTTALRDFLLSTDKAYCFDLYQIDLIDGTSLYYTSAQLDKAWGGKTFSAMGATLRRTSVQASRGTSASSLTLDVLADQSKILMGLPWLQAMDNGALDGACITLWYAYAPDPWSPIVGVIHGFYGRVADTETHTLDGSITVNSFMELLNVQTPPFVYQSSCRFNLFSSGCGLSKSAFQVASSIRSGSTKSVLQTGLTQAAGYFTGGKLFVTSGANAGAQRSIKAHAADGTLSLTYPLTRDIVTGDTFSIWPGCDHTKSMCASKFGNVIRFGGQPFIPAAETAI